SAITPNLKLTIAVHGKTALYVDGNVAPKAALAFVLDATATLDLFVAGTVTSSAPVTLGSTTAPGHCRAYVAGSTVTLAAGTVFGCNLYAPSAAVDVAAVTP